MIVDKTSQSEAQRNLYHRIGQRIRSARKKLHLTQVDLGDMVGLSRTSITNIERGRQNILVHTLYEIGRRLQVPIESLMPSDYLQLKQDDELEARMPEGLPKQVRSLILEAANTDQKKA
jgi:transcriptional regulator with XRE-family HTH domain